MTNKLLKEKNIQVVENAPDWQAAVKEASEPLIVDGSIDEQYVKNMINSVKEHGPYMVLADYFALMHARPGEGVNKVDMSLLVSKTPIDLVGKPVKIFLIMAAVDNVSHLKNLQEIMSVFMDNDAYNTILKGNKKEIVDLFKKMEEKK
ncbi:PTS sugar transporter subunit IIA [Pediococcus inopinatus]|nr:PTS sugar transporter subunit IIA [Pediococcus inopinatus]WPC18296.1 PTS sugar transporter subunit IIA [Pediococcus inopinatus]